MCCCSTSLAKRILQEIIGNGRWFMKRKNPKMWCNMGEILAVEKSHVLLKREVVNEEPVFSQQIL